MGDSSTVAVTVSLVDAAGSAIAAPLAPDGPHTVDGQSVYLKVAGGPFEPPPKPSDITASPGVQVTQTAGGSLFKITTLPSTLEAGNTGPFTAFISEGGLDVVTYKTRGIVGFMNQGYNNPLPMGIVGRVKEITVNYIGSGGIYSILGYRGVFSADDFSDLPGSARQVDADGQFWASYTSYGGTGTAIAEYKVAKAVSGSLQALPGGTVSVTMNYDWANIKPKLGSYAYSDYGSFIGYYESIGGSGLAVYPQSYTVSSSGNGFCVGDILHSTPASFLSSNPDAGQYLGNQYSSFISFDVTEIYPDIATSTPSSLSNTVSWITDPEEVLALITSSAVTNGGVTSLNTIPIVVEIYPASTAFDATMITLNPPSSMTLVGFTQSSEPGQYSMSITTELVMQTIVDTIAPTRYDNYNDVVAFVNEFQKKVTSTPWWGSASAAQTAALASQGTATQGAYFLYAGDTLAASQLGAAGNAQGYYSTGGSITSFTNPYVTISEVNAYPRTYWLTQQREIAVRSLVADSWTQWQTHSVSIPATKLGAGQTEAVDFNWTTSLEKAQPNLTATGATENWAEAGQYFTDAASVTIIMECTIGIVGFTLEDITITPAGYPPTNLRTTPASSFFQSEPTSFSFDVAPDPGVDIIVSIPANSFKSAADTQNVASNVITLKRAAYPIPVLTLSQTAVVQDGSTSTNLGNIEISLEDPSGSNTYIPNNALDSGSYSSGESIVDVYRTFPSNTDGGSSEDLSLVQITLGAPSLVQIGTDGLKHKIVIPITSVVGPGTYEFAVKGGTFTCNTTNADLDVGNAPSARRAGPYTVIPSDKATLTLSSSSYTTGSPLPGSTTSNNIVSLTFRSLFPMAIDVTTVNEANRQAVRTDPHLEGNPFPSVIGTSGTAQVSTIDGESQLVFYLDVSLCTILAPPLSAANGGYDVNFYLPLLYGTAECVFLDNPTSAITAAVTVEPVVGNVSGLSPSPSFKSINSWTKWIYDPIAGFDVTLETTTPYVNTEASLTLTIPSAAQIGVKGDASGNLTGWFSSVPPSNFTITDVNEAGTTWSIAADPQGPDGPYLVTLAEGIVFQGETFNNPVDCSFTYLDEPMTVSITSADANKTISTETVPFTIISSSQAESGHGTISKEDFDITSTNTSGVAHLAMTIDAPTNIDPPSQAASYLPRRTQWQGSATVNGDGTYTISLKAGILTDIFGNSQAASNVLSWRFQALTPQVTISADVTLGPRVTRKSVGLTFTLNQSGVAFAQSDVDVTNVTLSDWEQSTTNPLVYTATATVDVPTGSDENVSIACGVSVDQSRLSNHYGTAGSGTPSISWTYVQSQPTVEITLSTPQGALSGGSWTNASEVTATFTFDQDVTGFDESSITVVAPSGAPEATFGAVGQAGADQYEVTITVTGEGLYTVSVPANAVNADNVSNTASNVVTWHYQNQPPRLNNFYSLDVSAGQPTTKEDISMVLVANEPLSAVHTTKCTLDPDDMVIKGLTGSDENWTFTVSQPGSRAVGYLAQCSITCELGALVSSAGTGSASSDASFSFGWIYTNAPPQVDVSSSLIGTDPKTSQETILLSISCRGNEPIYDFDITKVVAVTTGGYSHPGPAIQLVPGQVVAAGQPWPQSISVRASVPTSTVSAVLLPLKGKYAVQVQQGAFADVNGTQNAASAVYGWQYSNERPTVRFLSSALDAYKGSSYPFPVLKFEMTLSEPCDGLAHDDIVCHPPSSVNAGQIVISSLDHVSALAYTFTVTVPENGAYSIYMPQDKIHDSYQNWNKESNMLSWSCQIAGPSATLSVSSGLVSGAVTNREYLDFVATFNQPLASGMYGNVEVEGNVVVTNTALDVSNQQLTFTTYAIENGTYTISLPAGIVKNKYASDSSASSSFDWTYSNVAPIAQLTTSEIYEGHLTHISSVEFDISFSEPCPLFAVTDIMLTTGDGNVVNQVWTIPHIRYCFSVNTSTPGDFVLLIPASSIVDLAGNVAAEDLSFNWAYTDVDPTYTVVSATTGLTFNTAQSSALLSIDALLTFTDKVFPRLSDIVLTNCKITGVSPSGATPQLSYVFTMEPLEKGHAEVDFKPTAFSTSDLGGVQPANESTISWTFTPTEPVVTIAGHVQSHSLTTRKSIALDITVSPSSVPFELGDISHSASLAAPSSFSGINTASSGSQVYSALFQLADMDPLADFTVDCWVKVAAGAVNNRSQINEAASSFYWTYTNVPPTPVITAVDISNGAYTDINPISLRIYVPDGISGGPFRASYITAADPTVVSIAHPRKLIAAQGEHGDTYELEATVTGVNSVSLSVRAGAYNDLAEQPNNASSPFTWHYNDAPLTLSVASNIPTTYAALGGITNESTITLTVTGSLVISSVDVNKIASTDGATFTHRVKSATTYQFVVSLGSSPSDGTYTMGFGEGAFTDEYGRASQQTSFSWVYSDVPPVPTIQPVVPLATGRITNRESIEFDVTFNQSGVVVSKADFLVSPSTASFSYTQEGAVCRATVNVGAQTADVTIPCKLSLPKGSVHDRAGNANEVTGEYAWTYTNSPPVPVILYAGDGSLVNGGFTHLDTNVFKIDVSDAVAVQPTVTLTGPSGTTHVLSVATTQAHYSMMVQVVTLQEGSYTLKVPAGGIVDTAGNASAKEVAWSWTYNNTKPSVTISAKEGGSNVPISSGGITNVAAVVVELTIDEPTAPGSFTIGDVHTTGGIGLSGWTPVSETVYSVIAHPSDVSVPGTYSIQVLADTFTDRSGLSNNESAPFSWSFSTARPTPTITAQPSMGLTSGGKTTHDVMRVVVNTIRPARTFGRSNIHVTDAAGGVITGYSATASSSGSTLYDVVIPAPAAGTYRAQVLADTYEDRAGNYNLASLPFDWEYEGVPPVVSLTSSDITSSHKVFYMRTITVSLSSTVPIEMPFIADFSLSEGLVLSSIKATPGAAPNQDFTLSVRMVVPVDGQKYTITLAAGNVESVHGRPSAVTSSLRWEYVSALRVSIVPVSDSAVPRVVIGQLTTTVKVVGNAPLVDFSPSALSIPAGVVVSAASVSGPSESIDLQVTAPSYGHYLLSLSSGGVTDVYGAQNTGSSALTLVFAESTDTPWFRHYASSAGIDLGCVDVPLGCPPRVLYNPQNTGYVTPIRGEIARQVFMVGMASRAPGRTRSVVEGQEVNAFGSNAGAPAGARGPIRNSFI
jgi:hypothetical protein